MDHNISLITTIASGFGAALVFGFIAERVKVPALVGYLLAGVLISIALNSFLFAAVEPLRRWALKHSDLARRLEQRQDPYAELPVSTERKFLAGQVVLVGYGRVGQRIAKALDARGIPYVVGKSVV